MSHLRYTLVGDGTSDRMLDAVIRWAIRSYDPDLRAAGEFVHSGMVRTSELREKVRRATALFPCDLLFIHRDAERANATEDRFAEIEAAAPSEISHVVPIVPIRMTEAWFVFHEAAIRRAANNPNGETTLDIPRVRDIERLPDPKNTVFELLRGASGLSGRRLRSFNQAQARARVAELIDDFSPLRAAPSFARFEEDCRGALNGLLRD